MKVRHQTISSPPQPKDSNTPISSRPGNTKTIQRIRRTIAIFGLALLEVLARLWIHFDPLSFIHAEEMEAVDDPVLLYLPKIQSTSEIGPINSFRFRGPEPDLSKPRRILVLGDSVAFGVHVSEQNTFARRLESRLGPDVVVLNAAVIGYQTWQEERYLSILDPVIHPTTIVVTLCQNDKARTSQAIVWRATRLASRGLFEESDWLRSIFSLSGISHSLWILGRLNDLKSLEDHFKQAPPSLAWQGNWSESWVRLLESARAGNRRTIALLIPGRDRLNGNLVDTDREAATLAQSLGVEIVDALNEFRLSSAPLYLPNDDIHLNDAGHAIVASSLAQIITQEHL